MADELSTTGHVISDAEFNAIIYRNIGSKYHGLITALNQTPDPVTFLELHGQLVAQEILLKNVQELLLVNIVSAPRQVSSQPRSSNDNSNSNGHYFLAPTRSAFRPTGGRRNAFGPCQICGYRNHTADLCRRRYLSRQQSFSSPSTNIVYQASPASGSYNIPSYLPSLSTYYGAWYLDSAATHHMVFDPSQLIHSNPYNGLDHVLVGNGQATLIYQTGIAVYSSKCF